MDYVLRCPDTRYAPCCAVRGVFLCHDLGVYSDTYIY